MTIVIVLYNSASEIEDCLASLPAGAQVIVVDNASSDDGAERAQRARPDATVIRSPENLGFGGGCELGWRAASTPYMAFVNPDVRLHPGCLEALLALVQSHPHAMAGPAMLEEGGGARPVKRAPSVWLDMLGLLPAAQRWAPSGSDGKLAASDPVHATGGEVDSLEGACFVLRREDLEAIGGFDPDLFLYFEEDSLALRLAGLGGRLLYEPRAVAEHSGQASTDQVRPFAVRQFHRSRVIFYRKRDGELRGRLAGALLTLAVLARLPSAWLNRRLERRGHVTPQELRLILDGILAGVRAPLGARQD
jgi:GT2 family glycosyltransferase